jgi:hypothetical protein
VERFQTIERSRLSNRIKHACPVWFTWSRLRIGNYKLCSNVLITTKLGEYITVVGVEIIEGYRRCWNWLPSTWWVVTKTFTTLHGRECCGKHGKRDCSSIVGRFPFQVVKSRVKSYYDWRSVGQPDLVSGTHLVSVTIFLKLLLNICGFVDVGRPLWRDDVSAVCTRSCC